MNDVDRGNVPLPWDNVLKRLALHDDPGVVEAVMLLWEHARPVSWDEPVSMYRGLLPALFGLKALLRAACGDATTAVGGLERLAAGLTEMADPDALIRPRATYEPVFAVLAELYPEARDGRAYAAHWDGEHLNQWARFRHVVTARLVDPAIRLAPDDPSTKHLARYPRLIVALRDAWGNEKSSAIEPWLTVAGQPGAKRDRAQEQFESFVTPIREALGRPLRRGKQERIYPEMSRLAFLLFGRVANPASGSRLAPSGSDPVESPRSSDSPPEPDATPPVEDRAGIGVPEETPPGIGDPPGDDVGREGPPLALPGDSVEDSGSGGDGPEQLAESVWPYRRTRRTARAPYVLPELPRQETKEESERSTIAAAPQSIADLARCDNLPLDTRHRALPDELLVTLFDALVPGTRFEAMSLFAQGRLLVILCAYAFHIRPSRLVNFMVGQAPLDSGGPETFNDATGVLAFRPEDALLRRVARHASHDAHEPVMGEYWFMACRAGLAGLLCRHIAATRRAFAPAEPPSKHLFWAADGLDGQVLRPLAITDLADWLRSLRPPGGLTIKPDDILAFGEALAYRADSRICPGALYWIAGTYSPRLRVVASYQALTDADRSEAMQRHLRALPDAIAARPRGWPADRATGEEVSLRLVHLLDPGTRWVPTAPSAPRTRCGTPRHLSLDYVARVYAQVRQEAWPIADATLDGLGHWAAACLRIFLGLRRTELRLLRYGDVIGTATDDLSLIVQGKPGGDGRIRPMEIPVTGEPARALRHYLRRAPRRADGKLFDPAIVDDVLALVPHGVRASLASFAVTRYQSEERASASQQSTTAIWYRWTPRDWLIVHALMGHEIADMPVGQDDETTHADIRRAMASLTAALHEELLTRAVAPPESQLQYPTRTKDGTATAVAVIEAAPSSPLALAFLARTAHVGARGAPAVARFLAGRLELTRWPDGEAARQQRVGGWYREAIIVEGDRQGRASWHLITMLGDVLVDAGVLETPPLLTRRGLREIAGPIRDLVGLADPAGTRLRAELRDDLARRCADGTPAGRVLLPSVAGLLLLLDCAVPDAIRAISEARWSDVRFGARIVRLPSASAALADDPHHDRAIALGPDTELALIALMRHGERDGGYILRPPGATAMTPGGIADMLRREWRRRTGHNASQRLVSAVASRHQRERHSGLTVTVAYEGRPARPIRDWDPAPLEAYIASGFRSAATRDMTPLLQQRSTTAAHGAERPEWLVALGRDVRRQLGAATERGVLSAGLTGHALALIAPQAELVDDREVPDVVATAMSIAADGDEARRANLACCLYFLSSRIREGKRDPRGRTLADAPPLARNTTRAYWNDLLVALHHIGATPLPRWSTEQWATLESLGLSHHSVRRLLVTLRQLRDTALTCGIPVLEGWTLAAPTAATPIALLEPARVEGLAQRLRDEGGEFAADLVRLLGIQLRHALRIGEAMALLARDVLSTGCWVDAGHTKDRQGRFVPRGATIGGFEEDLRTHLTATLAAVQANDYEPPFLAALADPQVRDTFERRYRTILARAGVWPHLLRHQGGTIYTTGARMARAQPLGDLPDWAVAAAGALDPLRALAAYLGHATTTYTAGTYDQSLHLRVRQANDHAHAALLSRPMTLLAMQTLLRVGSQRLQRLLDPMPQQYAADRSSIAAAVECARALIRAGEGTTRRDERNRQ